jgi:hypothetical protein
MEKTFAVYVTATNDEHRTVRHFYGYGDSVDEAVKDAEEEAFKALGEDAWIGDWYAA